MLKEQCRQFQNNLANDVISTGGVIELVKSQGTGEWYQARQFRITASNAKDVCSCMRSGRSSFELLKRLLWSSSAELKTKAMTYGRAHEAQARKDYFTNYSTDIKECRETGKEQNS